jgi:tRNA threonylcarbamoyladenosine biosynthesis protein TsaE
MTQPPTIFDLETPAETAKLAMQIGARLRPGDCILLEGGIGAGKTHFARSLVQSILLEPEDVPSPTFTLVQIYDTTVGEVWHADLYRLSSIEDVQELGLIDAFETAICLIEWPEKLGPLRPENALSIKFAPDDRDELCRHLTFDWSDMKWNQMMEDIAHA